MKTGEIIILLSVLGLIFLWIGCMTIKDLTLFENMFKFIIPLVVIAYFYDEFIETKELTQKIKDTEGKNENKNQK